MDLLKMYLFTLMAMLGMGITVVHDADGEEEDDYLHEVLEVLALLYVFFVECGEEGEEVPHGDEEREGED